MTSEPAVHYDRVTSAWTLLLGEELHYGVFRSGDEELPAATAALTQLMVQAARLEPGQEVLDVGCGTGAPACHLARSSGVRVVGISTSVAGVRAASERASRERVDDRVSFLERDGMDNGFRDESFDRAWALESSHLMRRRDRLMGECARVLRPGGRLALCDIMLRRHLDLGEVRRLRGPLTLLRTVFGDARMEPLVEYRRLAEAAGLEVDKEIDLTQATRPTFERWRANAHRHRREVVELLGEQGWSDFLVSCDVLEGFWDDGTLGYGLVSAVKR